MQVASQPVPLPAGCKLFQRYRVFAEFDIGGKLSAFLLALGSDQPGDDVTDHSECKSPDQR